MWRYLLRAFLSVTFCFLFTAGASAVVVTWDGGGGADTNWGTCTNWNPSNACPTSSDTATFDATSTTNVTIATSLTGATAPRGIDINTGYTGTITQNAGVTISVGVGNFDQADGIFLGGDSAITVDNTFTISGGAFTSTSGVLTISNAFTHTAGGTFTANGGTVTFIGTGGIINVNATETFYNLTFNATTGWGRTISDNDTLTVTNALTLTNGWIDQAVIPATGTIVVQGSLSQNANFDGGSGQINLESSATASLSSGEMPGFKVNSAAAVVTGPSSGTLTFEHHLTIADGTFNGGAGAMTLSGSTKNFSQSGGTFNGGAGTVTFPGAVAISGGTFNGGTTTTFPNAGGTFTFSGGTLAPGSGTLNVATNWTQSVGATFTEGTSTVNFYEGNGTRTIDIIVGSGGTETFYNLTFSTTTGWHKVVADNDTLTVSNVFTLTDGSLDQTTVPAAGTIVVQGSISHSANFDGGTAQVNLEGSGTAEFSSGTMTGFKLNGASAVATGPSSGTLNFYSHLLVGDGTFNAGAGAITLAAGKNFTQSGGTFNGGAGAVTFPGAIAISGGTFNGGTTTTFSNTGGTFTFSGGTLAPGSGTLNVATHWTQSVGATFTEGTSTVNFYEGNGDKTIDIIVGSGGAETFYNVIFNSTWDKIIANSDTLTVVNTLTLTDGDLIQTTIPAAGTIVVQGSISHSANFDGGTAQVNLEGSGTVSFVSGIMTGFKLNGAGAVATGPSSGTLTFENHFTIADGTFNAGVGAITQSTLKNFTQSGGTFNGGAGTVTFVNTVAISGGTFNGGTRTDFSCTSCTFTFSGGTLAPGSGALNVYTHWTQSGTAAFTEGTSTVAFIGTNGNKDITVVGSETFYNLSFGSGGAGKIIANSTTLYVSNNLVLTDGWVDQVTVPSTGTLSVNGNVTVVSTYDGGTGKLTFTGSAIQTFGLATAGLYNGDIDVNKSGGEVDLTSALTMDANNQDLTIQEGTFDLSGFALSVTAAGTEKIVVETGGNLQLQGGETITADSASYPQLDSGSKVTYDGTVGPYTLKDYTYHHLTINGPGSTFSMGVNEVLGGDLTATAGTFDINDKTLTINGNTLINGGTVKSGTNTVTFGNAGGDTVTISSGGLEIESDVPGSDIVKTAGTWTNSGGTITYNAATGIAEVILSGISPYYNLTINSAGSTYSLQALTDVDGSLAITAGTLDSGNGGNFNMTVGANWANTGVFTSRSGTVTFDSASAAAISGNTTFNNFTCVTAGKALTFTAGSTQTISGLFTLTGASGNLIILTSSANDSAWNLTVNGTSSVDYVSVRDSNAGGGNAITHAVSIARSSNVSNNTNWGFNAAPTVASITAVESSAGDGDVSITFIMDDLDDDNILQAKIEYSLDGGGAWADPTISITGSETTATFGDPSVNNAVTYQIGQSGAYITSSSGANTVVIVWESATDVLNSTDVSNAKIRITPYDGVLAGTAGTSSNFILDLVAPSGMTNFTNSSYNSSETVLNWTASTESNFNHYEIWYGNFQDDVRNRTSAATEWDNSDDINLATVTTNSSVITGMNPSNKYFKLFAIDNYGNESSASDFVILTGSSSSSGGGRSTSTSSSSSTTATTVATTDEGSTNTSTDSSAGQNSNDTDAGSDSAVVETPVETTVSFSDLGFTTSEDHWSSGYVDFLSVDLTQEQTFVEVALAETSFMDILTGIFTRQDEPMTRADAMELLMVMSGHDISNITLDPETGLAFSDLSIDDEQTQFVQYAYENGLVQGYPNGTFKPYRTVNRTEALKLVTYFFQINLNSSAFGNDLLALFGMNSSPFTDVDLNQWYAPYLINAYSHGVISGYGDGTFGPADPVTYAEFLKIATLMQNIEVAVELAEELE